MSSTASSLDVIWVIFCAILVSTMQAGFCCLESGLVRAKNSINVAIKNLVDFCIACSMFWLLGFTLMFGATARGLVGTQLPPTSTWTAQDYAFFLFELAFCGTATTIVSGAVAERMSFGGYFITAVVLSSCIYPITGHWVWGGLWFDTTPGWLHRLHFHDFAGSTVVHSVGAWTAFAAILIIGPRLGRFGPRSKQIDGHNLPIAVLGVFLLWFGWFGFNGGSTFAFTNQVPRILVNTAQGGAAGGLAALITTWIIHRRPQVPLIMNGVIGGLVSVTAGCDFMIPLGAAWAGAIGGILCTVSARLLSQYNIDDAVGVVPAHLVCGVWGTLAVPLFIDPLLWPEPSSLWHKLGVQLLGVVTVGLYAFSLSYLVLWGVNRIYPLRVTADQERIGLNISEHGASTAIQDLLSSMNTHSLMGDFTQPVIVEPETDVTLIANHYNRVLDTMNRMQADLSLSHDRLLKILNSPAFPVIISNIEHGIIQFLNERAAELFGFALQEAGRYRETDFWDSLSDRTTFLSQLQKQGRIANFEACLRRADDTPFWSLISGVEITYNDLPCVLFSLSDISVQIKRETTLRQLASTDSLTGIYNRRSFFELADQAIADLMQSDRPCCVLILDIDHFKTINDTLGHAQGDEVIRRVAQLCAHMLRSGDVLGRIGGEEFAVLLVKTSLSAANSIAERLRQRIERTQLVAQSDSIQFTVSVGVAAVRPGDTVSTALHRADLALYQAKAKGRNRVEQYVENSEESSVEG